VEINAGNALQSAGASNTFQVKVAKGQEEQLEAVVGEILSTIDTGSPKASSPRDIPGKGQLVNAVA